MNYRHFTDTLGQRFGYAGPVQLHLQSDGPRTLLDIWVSDLWDERRSDAVVAELFASYEPLQCVAEAALPFVLRIRRVADADFVRNAASGKLIHVCDHRAGA